MRLWISYEEDLEVLAKAQIGFPELFTDKIEEGQMGPFPLSYLCNLIERHKLKEKHRENCEWDKETDCVVCTHYSQLPDFPVPFLRLIVEETPQEIWNQIRDHLADTLISETVFFPHRLYEIEYLGKTFYLGYIDLLDITLVIKEAVDINT